jgi:peptidoglycan/xylan/chitin deacetylase (PgdA/CDA1 family)
MGWTELEALRQAGWSIGSHTASHARLAELGDAESLRKELDIPLEILRRRLGVEQVFLAFPFGARTDFSEVSLEAAMRAGYGACFSNFGGENGRTGDGAALRRLDIGANLPSLAWKARVHGMPPLWLRRLLDRVRS